MFSARIINGKVECKGNYPKWDMYDFIACMEESEIYKKLTSQWQKFEFTFITVAYDTEIGLDYRSIYNFIKPE